MLSFLTSAKQVRILTAQQNRSVSFKYVCMEDSNGWMDDLQFDILFNSILVISGQWPVIMKQCVKCNPVYK